MSTELRAYLNDSNLKTAFLAQIAEHEAADAIIKGTYAQRGVTFRGCAIGCSLHSLNVIQRKVGTDRTANTGNHERYEAELGLPTWLAYLEDNIFERLPDALAVTWPRRFAEAVPVGAVVDDRVLARILCWALTDTEFGVRYATDSEETRGWIDTIAAYIDADSRGIATADQREAAAWDARAARDAWAARAARDAWAARAAWAASDAWDAWAAWAAWDARAARDAEGTRSIIRQSEALLRLMAEAPTP